VGWHGGVTDCLCVGRGVRGSLVRVFSSLVAMRHRSHAAVLALYVSSCPPRMRSRRHDGVLGQGLLVLHPLRWEFWIPLEC
jgi:hypothetical protein